MSVFSAIILGALLLSAGYVFVMRSVSPEWVIGIVAFFCALFAFRSLLILAGFL